MRSDRGHKIAQNHPCLFITFQLDETGLLEGDPWNGSDHLQPSFGGQVHMYTRWAWPCLTATYRFSQASLHPFSPGPFFWMIHISVQQHLRYLSQFTRWDCSVVAPLKSRYIHMKIFRSWLKKKSEGNAVSLSCAGIIWALRIEGEVHTGWEPRWSQK